MAEWSDSKGRRYVCRLTLREALQLERDHGVSIADWISSLERSPVCAVLFGAGSVDTLCRILSVLCARSMHEHGVSVDDILDELSGDTLRAAVDAVLVAIRDFLPQPELRRIVENLRVSIQELQAGPISGSVSG